MFHARRSHILFGSIAALLFSSDNGGGGGATPEPINTLPKALVRITELEGAANTQATEVARITKELADARAEIATVKGQFDSASQAATDSKAAETKALGELSTAKETITDLTGKNTKAAENVIRLEKLCGVHGLAFAALTPAASEIPGEPVDHKAKYNALVSAGKSKEAGEYYAKHADQFFKK